MEEVFGLGVWIGQFDLDTPPWIEIRAVQVERESISQLTKNFGYHKREKVTINKNRYNK